MHRLWCAFIALILSISAAHLAYGIRAALDVKYEVVHNGKPEIIDCDFCSDYLDKDNIGVILLSVNIDGGSIEMYFQKLDAEDRSELDKKIHLGKAKHSEQQVFEVDFFQRTHVREGQTVSLKGTATKFRLIDVYGQGCPKGATC